MKKTNIKSITRKVGNGKYLITIDNGMAFELKNIKDTLGWVMEFLGIESIIDIGDTLNKGKMK